MSPNKNMARQYFIYLIYITMHIALTNRVKSVHRVNKNPTNGKKKRVFMSLCVLHRAYLHPRHNFKGSSLQRLFENVVCFCLCHKTPFLDNIQEFKVRRHYFGHLFCHSSRRLGHEKREVN